MVVTVTQLRKSRLLKALDPAELTNSKQLIPKGLPITSQEEALLEVVVIV